MVIVGTRTGTALVGSAVGEKVVVSRQPPNHPYLTQDVVGSSDVVVVVLAGLVIVVSSRQPTELAYESRHYVKAFHVPHHPGVLQVAVRVEDVVDSVLLVDVVPSLPLLLKYFQLKQSTHSSSGIHGGTSSYFSMTS